MSRIVKNLSIFLLLAWGIPQAGEQLDVSTEIRMLERAEFMKAMEKEVEEMFRKYENPEPDMFSWLLQLATPLIWFQMILCLLWVILEYILRKQELALKLGRFLDIIQLMDVTREPDNPLNWYMAILHVHCLIMESGHGQLDLAKQLRNHMFIMNTVTQVMDFFHTYWLNIRILLLMIVPSVLIIAWTWNSLLGVVVFQSTDAQWLFRILLYWSWISIHVTRPDLHGVSASWEHHWRRLGGGR